MSPWGFSRVAVLSVWLFGVSLSVFVISHCSGDVLLSINGQDLTYLSHSEAVGTLKSSAASCSVQLKALEVSTVEEPGLEEELLPPHENDYDASWSPSWVMWLGLPR